MSGGFAKIRLRGLTKRFGDKLVLDGVDLDIRAGHGMVILGGSGSGKSVTIKCILGLIEPDAGVIEVDGRNVLAMDRREREALNDRIGMLFQNGALFDSLPVWENVCFKLLAQKRIGRAKARDKAAEVLAQVGLAASVGDLYPSELSGGMQKRVALARAVAAEPDIIFFDEPTTGLDPIMGAVIDGLIVDCVKRLGATAVSITHDMASARRIGDDAAMLFRGRPCDPVRILTTSMIVNVPKETNTATSGWVRRHSSGAIAASAPSNSSGPGVRSCRNTSSTADHTTNAATKAQSRGPKPGGFAGRGSAHSERSAVVSTSSA